MPAVTQIAPTRIASMPARPIACDSLPAASGIMAAAIIGPSDESGPSTKFRDGPKRAYATRHITVVYRPVIAGRPASSAYAIPCGTSKALSTSPAIRSFVQPFALIRAE